LSFRNEVAEPKNEKKKIKNLGVIVSYPET